MGCTKTFNFSGGCPLEDCATADVIDDGATPWSFRWPMAYAPDLCYCCVVRQSGSDLVVKKYDPSTNTLIQKALIVGASGGGNGGHVVYEPVRQKFVFMSGTSVYIFDPLTDVVDSFDTGIPFLGLGFILWVGPHNKIYGIMGRDGLNQRYLGYIDLDLQIVVQIAVFPFTLGTPQPLQLTYVPSTDCVYGLWVTGIGNGYFKGNLTLNTAQTINGVIFGSQFALDTDRNLLVTVTNDFAVEFDPATETVTNTYGIGPAFGQSGGDLRFAPYYSSTLKKIFGCGENDITGDNEIHSYDTQTHETGLVLGDLPHLYDGLILFGDDGSLFTVGENDTTGNTEFRRVCGNP